MNARASSAAVINAIGSPFMDLGVSARSSFSLQEYCWSLSICSLLIKEKRQWAKNGCALWIESVEQGAAIQTSQFGYK